MPTESRILRGLKRVPPLNCHVEISNGLSVPLSWNSWSRTSRTRGAYPLTTRSAPFRALLFSSNHAQCLVHQYKLNISQISARLHFSLELCLSLSFFLLGWGSNAEAEMVCAVSSNVLC